MVGTVLYGDMYYVGQIRTGGGGIIPWCTVPYRPVPSVDEHTYKH